MGVVVEDDENEKWWVRAVILRLRGIPLENVPLVIKMWKKMEIMFSDFTVEDVITWSKILETTGVVEELSEEVARDILTWEPF